MPDNSGLIFEAKMAEIEAPLQAQGSRLLKLVL
jgi:hypothetical protein